MKATNFQSSLKYAWLGLKHAFAKERNFKAHLITATLVVLIGFFFKLRPMEWALIVFAITLVLFAELINTALENVVDLVSPDYHSLAKIAKNVSAGAVLITALNAIIIGLIILGKYFLELP